jgi:hypothetical protein
LSAGESVLLGSSAAVLSVLVRAITAVGGAVTEETLHDALTIVTSELVFGASSWHVVLLLGTDLLVVDGEVTGAAEGKDLIRSVFALSDAIAVEGSLDALLVVALVFILFAVF